MVFWPLGLTAVLLSRCSGSSCGPRRPPVRDALQDAFSGQVRPVMASTVRTVSRRARIGVCGACHRSCPVCFSGADAATRGAQRGHRSCSLGVTASVLALFARFCREAGRAPSCAAAHLRRSRGIAGLMLEWLGHARRRLGARGRSGPHHGARPLADAGAVRRLGRLLRLRARSLPRGAQPACGLPRRARPLCPRGSRAACWWPKSSCSRSFRFRSGARTSTRCRPNHDSTVVRVVAEQFAWNVHYPGADGMFGRTRITARQPDNPLGLDRRRSGGERRHHHRSTSCTCRSANARHRLSLQQGRGAQPRAAGDAREAGCGSWHRAAGVVHANQTGRWEIACSQLCGLAHYRMKAFYTIQTLEQFQAWLDEEAAALQPQ